MFKRGEVQFGLKQLIYLILSLIVLLLLLLVAVKLWAQFSGKVIDEASLNNYNNLVEEIKLLMEDSKKTEIVMPYYIRGEFMGSFQTYGLIGYGGIENEDENLNEEYLMETCGPSTKDMIHKDFIKCRKSQACLCLVGLPSGIKVKNVDTVACFSNEFIVGYYVDTDYRFKPPYAGIILKENKALSNLIIWGQCTGGGSWGVRNLVIRKEKVEGDNYRIVFSNEESAGYKGCCCIEQNSVRGCEPEKCDDSSICDGFVDNKGYNLIYYQTERCEDVVVQPQGKCEDIKKEDPVISEKCCCIDSSAMAVGCTPKECKQSGCKDFALYSSQSCEDYGLSAIDNQYCS